MSVARAAPVANIKEGGGARACHVKTQGEERGAGYIYIYIYIRTSRVPRYETHWTTLSPARANSRTVETVCPAN